MKKYLCLYLSLFLIICILFYLCRKTSEYFEQEYLTAAIIEPREHEDLDYVVKQFRQKLPDNVKIIVYYGKGRTDFIKRIVSGLKNVKIVELDKDNFNADDYNYFVKTDEFWKHIKSKKLLIFQTDSMMCQNSDYNIYNFENIDYVGARTVWDNVINGGLSLRDVEKSKQVLSTLKPEHHNVAEDCFFAEYIKKDGGNVASKKDQDKFATQSFFETNVFGGHQVSNWLSDGDKKKFYEYCPEYKKTMK